MGYVNACQVIRKFVKRMQGVMIERLDFRTLIEKYDSEEAFFYVDPPYAGREKSYAGGFTLEDHYELGELLNSARGKVILSYYDDPIIAEIYGHWNIERHSAFKQAVGGQNVGGLAEELLIMNYETRQLSLFD
ncbi:DNA adenine methylase [Siminovitchia terrae]|uniref:DNA adenine methylase n=1 Tax=Siminovitchia terrae TaxID=1914933 RepID=A0A429XAJ5_SIMTE|nr:DNA adenine methylase [Siminovitchia terrae]